MDVNTESRRQLVWAPRGGRATAPAAAGRAGPRANPGGGRHEKHRAREKGPEMRVSRTAAARENLKT